MAKTPLAANPRALCLPVRTSAVISAGILALCWLPVIEACVASFKGPGKVALAEGFSLGAYLTAVDDTALLLSAYRSLTVGIGSALLSTIMGGSVAIAAHVVGGRVRALLTLFYVFPLVTPDVMIGLALSHTAAEFGAPVNLGTLIVAHSVFGSALCFFVVTAGIDERVSAALDSAVTLSLSRLDHLAHVLRPLLTPAIVAGACVALIVSLDDFGVTYFMVRPGQATLPVTLFGRLSKGLTTQAFAAACGLAFVNSLGVVWILKFYGERAFGLGEARQ